MWLLTENGCSPASVTSIINHYPLAAPPPAAADAQGTAYLTLLVGRLPDTTQVEPLLRRAVTGSVPAELGVASTDDTAVINAATTWLARLDSFSLSTPQAADTWQPSRLEHRVSITAKSPTGTPFSFIAPAWPGRPLEWSDFDVPAQTAVSAPASLPRLPGTDPATGATITGTGPPHPLTYPGAPARRYWTFEDGSFNLAAVTVGPDDLVRMLIVEFASVYAKAALSDTRPRTSNASSRAPPPSRLVDGGAAVTGKRRSIPRSDQLVPHPLGGRRHLAVFFHNRRMLGAERWNVTCSERVAPAWTWRAPGRPPSSGRQARRH